MEPVVRGSQEEKVGHLLIAGLLITFLPQIPLGNYLIYPFTILTTWFHEMGHGLTAMALGADFQSLEIYRNGSGLAQSQFDSTPSAVTSALVGAGGPLGPSIFGSLLILASAKLKYVRPALIALAALIGLSTVIWVATMTGFIVLPLVALALVGVAMRASDRIALFSIQFLGILAALSMFRDWDYLFSYAGVVAGRPMLSDTGAISEALWLPYWFWAIVIIAVSGLMIGASLKYALAEEHSNRFISRR
ncbi:M50 family metallopeptidase [Pontixanthobacter aestiaquae]|uniref:M50 family peptidase n=1 Tax=Pontixanthobacter aestiaquae TaxID=1509367 RepID=A0A844Z0V9_9SPHN|nr:M50 family metallopeptidase [Pontixanthobacter aestiaquae]MDN3646656.1 M50 family metallopeptidase [Pontixanthobacter aestiaquae]MXO82361.1 M50 family peptidase [Pontixanthobacter aestiaquae]